MTGEADEVTTEPGRLAAREVLGKEEGGEKHGQLASWMHQKAFPGLTLCLPIKKPSVTYAIRRSAQGAGKEFLEKLRR